MIPVRKVGSTHQMNGGLPGKAKGRGRLNSLFEVVILRETVLSLNVLLYSVYYIKHDLFVCLSGETYSSLSCPENCPWLRLSTGGSRL